MSQDNRVAPKGPAKGLVVGRRGFFKAFAGVGAAAALGAGGAAPVLAQQTGDERTKARYQETDHVKAYYRTNRYYKKGE
jgi:nitrous oxide reductase